MGFGKFLLGAAAAVGAVVAAPIVLPAAAAAGASIAAGAAAAGATVAASATAVGATVTAAAGTVATAAASTAVGSAVVSGAATVGSAVGAVAAGASTVAEAAGLATVASGIGTVTTITGTSAGAAAVGTIATSTAVGAASGISGAKKMNEASKISNDAERKSSLARAHFDIIEKDTNDALSSLGKTKVTIWNGFNRFKEAFEKIKNMEDWEKLVLDKELHLDKNEMANIKVLAMSAKDVFKGGALALTGGQLAGLATSTGFTGLATASTGTAISSLSGVAASNASLAALGGGSLASGGLGMAGGAIVSSALAAAPAIAIGGLFINSKGNKSLENAEDYSYEVDKYISKLREAEKELNKLTNLANSVNSKLIDLKIPYESCTDWLVNLVNKNTDFLTYTNEEKQKLFLTCQLVSILKNLTLAQLIETKDKKQVVLTQEVNDLLKETDEKMKSANI